ncbi:lipopolysaccharide kinase InaA family protein [Parabacteroides sp. PF5-9]|uniref:lipopolysaccharide kinase InaA family protein n=1 Tax=Parabacteroides sp. PF5-9 TaxID=1742404 RepID=UPI002473C2F3|nr:lipopolysaccharide kinase InaA family protein [Parabacteroides sp. PF5-9]MDH6356701.1 tRNA A-37 threonylcarbamoyl transferase component Bud32 [Parabacteroides sp. PF5-9]
MHHTKWTVHPTFYKLESFILQLPDIFDHEGEVIYQGRNELRLFHIEGYPLIVKSYQRPHLFNRIAYTCLRASKAERAYLYALKLIELGIGTPAPVGYIVCRDGLLMEKSYSVSLQSDCPHLYKDFYTKVFSREKEILTAIARTTAHLHMHGILHKDYSEGNILFDDSLKEIPVELIDLNRMVFGKVSLEKGCKNFERLLGSDEMLETMGEVYAKERHLDPVACVERIKYHVHQRLKMLNSYPFPQKK